jgi:predicted RNA-binding Zn-ribbon protein involved in translation (DUF1610 family)
METGEKDMSDRKYRQRGYMDSDRERPSQSKQPQQSKQRPRQGSSEGPRSPKMMAFGTKVKCANCGATVETSVNLPCPKCNAALHSCRNAHSSIQALASNVRSPSRPRIVNKQAQNTCELFEARTVVERETSSSGPMDARKAFDKLFKK